MLERSQRRKLLFGIRREEEEAEERGMGGERERREKN
jgi:hypothetical protein